MNLNHYKTTIYPPLRAEFNQAFKGHALDLFYIQKINTLPSVQDTFNPRAHPLLAGYIMSRALVLDGKQEFSGLQDALFEAFEHASSEGLQADKAGDDLKEKLAAFRPPFRIIRQDIDAAIQDDLLAKIPREDFDPCALRF